MKMWLIGIHYIYTYLMFMEKGIKNGRDQTKESKIGAEGGT